MTALAGLPIAAVLGEVDTALARAGKVVLVAPPGAGKTTGIPVHLLGADWRGDGTILVLEPRRIAARGAASRMAEMLGEGLGRRVGLRTRFESRFSPETRILVVTEGVFTRMIVDDPELAGIAAVLFDEFHERSLDADFGLALALETQSVLRPDLRLLVMSATLDDRRIAAFLGDVPVIQSEGRAFPVETRYRSRDPNRRIEAEMATAILAAIRSEPGSLLAFLPGQGEIERVKRILEEAQLPTGVDLCPLYGALDPAAQDAAIRPAQPGQRKIVLATAIAETSITIEGVRIVVDSGLQRVPRYEPDLGISRLDTVRVSRASADQRRGRAGRTEPGIAIRLWDEPQDQGLLPFNRPEILESDLASFRLDCAAWGADPRALALIDAPPEPALKEADAVLRALDALDDTGRITQRGKALRSLPLAPRLAAMVLDGAACGAGEAAAQLAALISERSIGGPSADLNARLDRFRSERSPRAIQMRDLAARWAKQASRLAAPSLTVPGTSGALLLRAFPDRLARGRGDGQFQLANGRMAALEATESLAREGFLVVADLTGAASRARITMAAPITREDIEAASGEALRLEEETVFDRASGALRRRRMRRYRALVLETATLPVEPGPESAGILAQAAASHGIDRLGWSKAQRQLRDRVAFLRKAGDATWPDLSAEALAATVGDWLAPFLHGLTRLDDIDADCLGGALDALLPYARQRDLAEAVPTHFLAPTGSHHAIDYEAEQAPLLSIRVQELFGLTRHPTIAGGRLMLTLELLSPAHRPIQITRDLPGFWAGSWADVRSQMKGRYPRHPWPEDPAQAAPTTRAKPRGT